MRPSMNIDRDGLFVTKEGDGGDTLANESSYGLATKFSNSPAAWSWQVTCQSLQPKKGIWIRHPDLSKWYSDPRTTSRDQLIPTMIVLGMNKQYKDLFFTQARIILRGFFAQNIYRNWDPISTQTPKIPDTLLGHINVMIRCWGTLALPLYPVVLLWDIISLVVFLTQWMMSSPNPSNCDDRNGINAHIVAIYALPTPFSYLERYLYARYRTATLASIPGSSWANKSNMPIEKNRVMGALTLYFWENNQVIAEAYRPIIKKYFTMGER